MCRNKVFQEERFYRDSLLDEKDKGGRGKMEKIRLYYDSKGNTLNVWFDEPKKEHICEETGEEVILVKDKKGKVIGFEKLNFLIRPEGGIRTLPVEVLVT